MGITIAISFYNADHYLLDSIKSVFAQTYQNWELILIDDGSTDRSLEIANSIKDSRVRVISDGKNKKLAGRLNEVTELAKYDFIARMDADDLMVPNRLEIQMKVLENNPEFDIVTSGVYSALNDLTIIGKRGTDYKGVSFKEIISRKKGVTHAAVLARKSWYKRNKYNENLKIAQDLELWTRSSFNNDLKVISLKEPLYIYREEGNVTFKKLLAAYTTERGLINHYKGLLNKLYIKSLIKSLAINVLKIFQLQRDFQKKRNHGLDTKELHDVSKIIAGIRATKIPGL